MKNSVTNRSASAVGSRRPSIARPRCTSGHANPTQVFIESLKKVDQLEADLVLPAHEDVFEDLHGRIAEIIAHHEARLAHALQAIDLEAKTAYEIAAEMPWLSDADTGEEKAFADLDESGRAMATGEAWAHLEYLRFKGKVCTEPKDGLIYYKAV